MRVKKQSRVRPSEAAMLIVLLAVALLLRVTVAHSSQSYRHVQRFTATAYCLTGHTATGMYAGPGIIAVDPRVIPLGAHVYVSGYGRALAADTGGAIQGHVIDVWLSCRSAIQWGRRTVTVSW